MRRPYEVLRSQGFRDSLALVHGVLLLVAGARGGGAEGVGFDLLCSAMPICTRRSPL
jgi:hypothetical protein